MGVHGYTSFSDSLVSKKSCVACRRKSVRRWRQPSTWWGRDQQDQILYLKKDADTQIWNLEKVENELHKEPPDHVLDAVAGLLSAEHPIWTGSPSALADAVHVGMAANALSKYLNVKSGRLLDEYHVRYENKVRHEGRRITLTYDAESK